MFKSLKRQLGENSLFTLEHPKKEVDGLLTRIRLEVGKVWIILQGGALEVETPSGVAAVRGSYMYVTYSPDTGEMRITCLEGDCSLSNEHGTVNITAGQTAIIISIGQSPQVGVMSDEDIQNWLNNNPEALLVIPYLTEIAPPLPALPPSFPSYPPVPIPPPLKPLPTVQINSIEPSTAVVGEVINFNVSVLPIAGGPIPTGSVEVKADVGLICTATLNASGLGSCNGTLPSATTHNIQAFYTGDVYYGTNHSTSQPYMVTKASTTTTIDPYNSPSVVGETVTINFTVAPNAPGSGTPYGNVTVSSGADSCTTPASTGSCDITFSAIGVKTLVANFAGDSSYAGSSSAGYAHTVNKASTTTIIINHVPNPSTLSTAVTFTATVDNVPPGSGMPFDSVIFSDGQTDCIVTSAPWSCSITFINTGIRTVAATYSGDANFNGSVSDTVEQYVALDNNTYFYNIINPDAGVCTQSYSVDAIDADGVSSVEVEYKVNDADFSSGTTKVVLALSGVNTWAGNINISRTITDIVYWRFIAIDSLANPTLGTTYNYTSTATCP